MEIPLLPTSLSDRSLEDMLWTMFVHFLIIHGPNIGALTEMMPTNCKTVNVSNLPWFKSVAQVLASYCLANSPYG